MSHKHNASSSAQLEMVGWAARVGAVTADALAQRDGCALASARGRLQAAKRSGLLAASRPLVAAPTLYVPTRAGLLAIGSPLGEISRVTAANARHTSMVATVAAALERRYPDHRVTGERQLRNEEREQGGPLASAQLGGAKHTPQLHRPDLVLWEDAQRSALPLAVEVELTVKAPQRLLEICQAWARSRCVSGVLYLASPEVMRPLQRAIENARARERILALGLGTIAPSAERNVSGED